MDTISKDVTSLYVLMFFYKSIPNIIMCIYMCVTYVNTASDVTICTYTCNPILFLYNSFVICSMKLVIMDTVPSLSCCYPTEH